MPCRVYVSTVIQKFVYVKFDENILNSFFFKLKLTLKMLDIDDKLKSNIEKVHAYIRIV
jgi:hypothetical protein